MTSPTIKAVVYSSFALFLFITALPIANSQESAVLEVGSTLYKNFQRDSILKMTLSTNTKKLVAKKYKEEWQPIQVNFKDTLGVAMEWKAKVRARGKVRKQVCFYPPLKLKFKKKWLVKNDMDSSFNDVKLVIGCKKGDFYGKLVLKEYLIYQLYEALTEISFRTQLAEIEFIDSEGKWKPFTTFAFIIENEDEMATRLNAKCAKPKRLRSKYIYAEQLDKLNLFQFMIGNTDWSAIQSHNIRLIKCKDYPLPLPIAYDFDYAGLVEAPYAVHGEGIELKNITDRLFLGMCREKGVLEKQIPLFKEKEAIFFKIINDFPYLDKKEKDIMVHYIEDFYKIINSPKRFKREIADICRKAGR